MSSRSARISAASQSACGRTTASTRGRPVDAGHDPIGNVQSGFLAQVLELVGDLADMSLGQQVGIDGRVERHQQIPVGGHLLPGPRPCRELEGVGGQGDTPRQRAAVGGQTTSRRHGRPP